MVSRKIYIILVCFLPSFFSFLLPLFTLLSYHLCFLRSSTLVSFFPSSYSNLHFHSIHVFLLTAIPRQKCDYFLPPFCHTSVFFFPSIHVFGAHLQAILSFLLWKLCMGGIVIFIRRSPWPHRPGWWRRWPGEPSRVAGTFRSPGPERPSLPSGPLSFQLTSDNPLWPESCTQRIASHLTSLQWCVAEILCILQKINHFQV